MHLLSRLTRLMLATTLAAGALIVQGTSAHATPPPVARHGVRIVEIYFDSPGPDNATNKSLNGEWVLVKNVTDVGKNITGWTLRDSSSHRYMFPKTIIAPHATVKVHTGRGFRNPHNRYWASTTYIWNNSGDTAKLANARAVVQNQCMYSQQFDSIRKFC